MRPLDEAVAQTALAPQPPFDSLHSTFVSLMIVAQEVQQPMKRQHFELGQLGVARFTRLAPRDAARDHDVP